MVALSSVISVYFCTYREKRDLIMRWRGTVCRKLPAGFEVVSWQKSMYRFGGLYREVPIAVKVVLDDKTCISSVVIDENSCGSQAKVAILLALSAVCVIN